MVVKADAPLGLTHMDTERAALPEGSPPTDAERAELPSNRSALLAIDTVSAVLERPAALVTVYAASVSAASAVK